MQTSGKAIGKLSRLASKEIKDRASNAWDDGIKKGVRNITTDRSRIRKQNKATRARLGKTARGVSHTSKKRK